MNKIPLLESACRELLSYGVHDMRTKCKYLVKRLLLHRKTPAEDLVFWPTGLLTAGLWHCREELIAGRTDEKTTASGEKAPMAGIIEQSLAAYYMRWFKKDMPIAVLDDLLAGETLLDIYLETQRGPSDFSGNLSAGKCKAAVDRLAAFADKHAKDGAGSLIYRPAHGETTVFVDGVGLACPFLYRYGETFGKQEYRELALLQIENFLSCGMDGATGLPYHGYDAADGCKYGIIGWGRAVGWLLRGMTGCMISEYGREKLKTPYTALVDAVLAYQRQDGYFSWQMQAVEGPADTSATGMICAAFRRGMEYGILTDKKGESYGKALLAGRRALEKSVRDGLVYDCSGECEGFSCYPQRYGAYPWALGPALEVL